MKSLELHERLSEKFKSFLNLVRSFFRLALRFEEKSRSVIPVAGRCINEAVPVCQKAFESKKGRSEKRQQQIAVTCPDKIRKRIWKNLCAAAKSRVNPTRAKIAREMLAEIDKGGSLANFQPKSNPVKKDTYIEVAEPSPRVAENLALVRVDNNKKPKSHDQRFNQQPFLRFEWSPELKRICLRNNADELVDDMEEPREILIVPDNICI